MLKERRMKDTFKFTLYELFGYLFPGIIALAGLSLLDLVIFHRHSGVNLSWCISSTGLAAGAATAYVLGHAIQIAANFVLPTTNAVVLSARRFKSTQDLLVILRASCDPEVKDLSNAGLVEFCDQRVQIDGPSADREIFVYREGFYRGMVISLALLAIASFIGALIPSYADFLKMWGVARAEGFLFAILALSIVIGMYFRSIRFANYRISLALTNYISKGKKETHKELDSPE